MPGVGGAIWCGVSAPVVQGFLVGLGVVATGLMFFPFDFRMNRPRSGPMLAHAKAKQAIRWSRRVSWLLAVLTAATIVGYVVIFVSVNGKFCGVPLSPGTERLIVVWTIVTALAVATLAISAWLRRRAGRAEPS